MAAPGRRACDDLYGDVAREYGAALERLARAYEPDVDKRRDLLQDIHVALWRSLERFDGRCSMRTWVYRVAHNTATSQVLRRRSRGPALVSLDEIASAPDGHDGEREVDERRALDRLLALIQALTPLDRQVIVLIEIGAGLIIAATAFVVYYMHTKRWVSAAEVEGPAQSGVDFYRAELLRQRDVLRGVWWWYLLPFVPGFIVVLIGRAAEEPERAPRAAVAGIICLLVFLHIGRLNERAARKLQRDIDALPKD